MAEQFKPCPGCGAEPFVSQCVDPPRLFIECKNCSFAADESDWQTRTPGPATKAMLEYARTITETARQIDHGQGFKPDVLKMVQDMEAFLAEWPDPATPPAPEQPEQSPWHCAICGEPVRIADDLRPWHPNGPENHAAELSDEDRKTLADGLRLTD